MTPRKILRMLLFLLFFPFIFAALALAFAIKTLDGMTPALRMMIFE